MTDKFENYHAAQSWFAKNAEIYSSSRKDSLKIICSKVAEVMQVQRVGVWFFTPDHEALYEEMTHSIDSEISHGMVLRRSKYPNYFKHIEEERVVVGHDTFGPGPFSELIDSYMKPLDVHALLDAPIFSDGAIIGVLCCEVKKTTRDWDIHDKNFVSISADFIARIIESEKRHTYEKELHHRITYLENDLRKKLDDLNEAKISLDMALEGAQVGKWDWDIRTDKVALSRTWFTKLGYQNNELPQAFESFRKTVHPEDFGRVLEELEKHLKRETPFYECRFRMFTKTGEIQWCLDRGCVVERDKDGNAVRMTGVNINVTPIMKWEQSLIASEKQLKLMISSLPTPVAMFDKNFKFLAFSSRWAEEWSTPNPPKVGDSLKDTNSEWIDIFKEAMTGKTIRRDEDLREPAPGVEFWLRWEVHPWKTPSGEIGGVIAMAENITNRKQAEIKIAQTSKLTALGEMAGGIAHEINNPLSIIKGYIDLLRRQSSRQSLGPELLLQYINKMDQTVARISRIVNGMRRFSRESSQDEKVRYSLNKIIEETLDICQERMNNNGTAIEVEYLPEESFIFCRPVEISQVLLNLINNSYQVVSDELHPWIKIKLEDAENYFRIYISDSGEGIPPMVRHKLFQPFFTTKDIGVGTGLGLSISRGIVEEHHGKILYKEDAPNTTFIIELPKYKTREAQITEHLSH
ncbi:MAG: ATP-binding protein [Bacteriovoracaceae bacterium]